MAEPKSYLEKIEADLVLQEQKTEKKHKEAEKAKYIAVGVLLGLWLVGLLVLTGFRYIPNVQYIKAVKMLENESFKEAVLAFEKLNGLGSSEYYLETIYAQFPQYKLINAKEGEMVTYGMYNQEQNVAPIEWYIIVKEENRALLISRHIIDAQPYSGEVGLQTWLEKNFRINAFSDNENKTVSEILILNREQIDSYVTGKEFAKCEPTTFARSRGYGTNYAGNYMWWISESSSGGRHFVASQYGYVGRDVSDDTNINGVRPAIWISFE